MSLGACSMSFASRLFLEQTLCARNDLVYEEMMASTSNDGMHVKMRWLQIMV